MMIHRPKKISRLRIPQCSTRSALEKNFRARASSTKPRTIFTDVSQPPDLGNRFSQPGKRAKTAKGSASARPKPPMPIVSWIALPLVARAPASRVPRMGPVQEKETRASVRAIKNTPAMLPTLDFASALLAMPDGRVISKSPKKDNANATKITKKDRFSQMLVEMLLRMDSCPDGRK